MVKKFHPVKGKSVYIIFHGKALGDTLAFFPYVEQYRIVNKCNVKVYLPRQEMIPFLKPNYPNIEFLSEEKYIGSFPGGPPSGDNIFFKLPFDADNVQTFKVGTSWDGRQHMPMQKSASECLGLKFKELKPKLSLKDRGRPFKEKYVTIGVHSNGPQLKYWNYPNGWKYVVNYLKHKGYRVLAVDLRNSNNRSEWINETPNNVETANENPIDITMNNIAHSEFFIGLPSGLSWLSWALNKHVIMIQGMTKPWFEFQDKCIHVHNNDVCNGCWHRDETLHLKGDWGICPDHKGTDRQFECTKEIDPPMVFKAIDKVIRDSRK